MLFSQEVALGFQFIKIFDEQQLEFVILSRGEDETSINYGKIAAFQIQGLLVAYKERFDKDNFIKNLLLDNLLLVDIYNRSKKLHIENHVRRVVLVVEVSGEKDGDELDRVRTVLDGNIIGYKGSERNQLGKILMKVRDELK